MKKNNGFSLIELLTVIGIIGILASISYPSYQSSVVRARRADAKAALMAEALKVENFYNETNSYQDAALELALPKNSSEGFYSVNITVPDPDSGTGYLLTATPLNGQGKNDRECQAFTFNEQGIESITSGPEGTPTANAKFCWNR